MRTMRGARMLALALVCSALLAVAAAEPPSAAKPANITGTFRGARALPLPLPLWSHNDADAGIAAGTWESSAAPNATRQHELLHWVSREEGSLLLAIRTAPSQTTGVEHVKGDLVLAAGDFANDHDVRMAVEGLYVRATGELRLLAASSRVSGEATPEALAAAQRHSNASGLPAVYARRTPQACTFRLTAKLPPAPAEVHRGRPSITLVGVLDSTDCDAPPLRLNATLLHTDALVEKANSAAMLAAATGLVLLSLTARQMESSASGSAMTRVSLACVCHQSVLDSFACLLHLTGSLMVDALFSSFFTAALCYFALFSFFEMRWMMSIARARAPDVPWRQELSALQTKFYLTLVGCAGLCWLMRDSPLALSLLYGSFWLWQIGHSAVTDAVRALSPRYVLGVSAARLVLPLYVLACPENWLSISPRPDVAAALVLWVGAQAAVLCAQHRYGARCCVPYPCRPTKYVYARAPTPAERLAAVSEDAEAGEASVVDCIICMNELSLDTNDPDAWLTPCGHAFHKPCLERWMDIKLECPTCRRPLPLP
jgi:hypothetical protein